MKNQVESTGKTVTSQMHVVHTATNNVEKQMDRHVKSIESLIKKLRPSERQKYFQGMLAHILSIPMNDEVITAKNLYGRQPTSITQQVDYNKLGEKELYLLQEMSSKLEQLHRLSSGETFSF